MLVDIRNTPPPAEWGVTISSRAIDDLADRWRQREFPLPAWDYKGLPRGLEDGDWYNLCVAACSVLACIWPPEGKQMWTTHFDGDDLDDAPAVFSCFSRRIADNSFDLAMLDGLTAEEFFAGDGVLQLSDEKWRQLNDVIAAIQGVWSGAVGNLIAGADRDAERVVDLLAETVPGFRDAPDSPLGTLPFFKLARLATAMMSAGGSTPLRNLDRLPVYPDYMLPRVFRHFGIMVYAEALAAAVDSRRIIEKESSWELAIRWATVYCGDRLAEALRERDVAVSTPALDYALWESAVLGPDADSMGEHHRTLTLAY
ncbi:MAG: queuosine salvage family protein [Acidimicrobiia bacterium]|nr:queuosine salvage family protein [Acidimicrobiia bacterium]